jgi:hypothetical protein
MRYEYGQDEVLLALGDTFYAYRDGAVISAPTEGIAAFEKREAQLHASLAQLRACVMAPIHLVSDRCDLVRAGWSRSLTGLVGWSRPAASYDTVAMAVRHLAEHIVCDDPRGARLDGGGGRDDARPW